VTIRIETTRRRIAGRLSDRNPFNIWVSITHLLNRRVCATMTIHTGFYRINPFCFPTPQTSVFVVAEQIANSEKT
jgi:hypothetical protein